MARKRANGEGSISKRSNGTWEGRITAGFDPSTGKQIRKSIYGHTQKEVREKMNELQLQYANVSTVEEIDAVGMTLSEWLDTWLADYIQDVKPGTKVSLHLNRGQPHPTCSRKDRSPETEASDDPEAL